MTQVWYKDENTEVKVCEVVGHVALVQDALDVCGVDMDDFASEQGWDDYDPNALETRYTD